MGEGKYRNEPCWCGSGDKLKKCHWERSNQEPLPLEKEYTQLRKAFQSRSCFHPLAPEGCSGSPINSHTVPRASLAKIADKSRVWWIDTDVAKFMKNNATVGMKLVGIREASTFGGFCAPHDADLFRPIEDQPPNPKAEHVALFCYRAICYETMILRGYLQVVQQARQLDRGHSPDAQIWLQGQVKQRESDLISMIGSLDQKRDQCAALLDSPDPTNVFFFAVELGTVPDVMASGVVDTRFDFQGRENPDPSRTSILTFSMVASGEKGLALLGWIGDQPATRRFVDSIASLSDDELPHGLARLAFEKVENRYWSPQWWATLDNSSKQSIISRLQPNRRLIQKALVDDGLRLVNWTVLKRIRSWV